MIHLQKVMKSYPVAGDDLVVLKDIDLQINKGEFVAIMGPSGSGKSTLMNIIGCLDKPTDGDYLLNGKRVSDYDEKELAQVRNRSVGFVFQQFQLLPRLNALQNVELPMIYAGIGKKERLERAKEALAKVGLSDRTDHLPNALSGGQKQRVAIARAIVNEPDIILADEQTGALDSKTGVQIMEMFTMLNKEGTTVILVTHEAEVASYADRTIFVRDGMLTSAESVVDQETFEKLIELEFDKIDENEMDDNQNVEYETIDNRLSNEGQESTNNNLLNNEGNPSSKLTIEKHGEKESSSPNENYASTDNSSLTETKMAENEVLEKTKEGDM